MDYSDEDEYSSSSVESECNNETNGQQNNSRSQEYVITKRRTNVGPWRNKEEFDKVYLSLYGPNTTNETKAEACEQMTVWKIRAVHSIPAAILSTLVLTQIQLKDNPSKPSDEMQLLYAGAFTRFLNFMASTSYKGNRKKTMYQIAMEMGIDPFIVDLRHLCSHGKKIPSLDILRTSSEICIDWLKKYYWDNEYKNQENVDAKDVRKSHITEFDDHVTQLFKIYDIAMKAEFNNCNTIEESSKFLNEDDFKVLKEYSRINGKLYINHIKELVIKNIENVTKQNSTFELETIFIQAFYKMTFIFEIPANLCKTKISRQSVIKNNRKLFRSIAIYGFIEQLFNEIMLIAENNSEPETRRKGASFWANEIVTGFIAFNKFKYYCKEQKDKDENFEIKNKDLYNIDGLPKQIKKIYFKLGYDTNSIILFGDHFKRPWTLDFTPEYIEERLKNICSYTKKIVKNCIPLVDPPLSKTKKTQLEEIINIFLNKNENSYNDENNEKQDKESSKIYDLDEDLETIVEKDNIEMKEEKKYGIWTVVDDDEDWHLCPLGRLPWQ